MRLFFAILLPSNISEALKEVQRGFKNLPQIRLVPPQNLHITLSFLGEVQPRELQPIIAKAKSISLAPKVVSLKSLNGFPRSNCWRVAVVEVNDESALLQDLHSLLPQGEKPERYFTPHITLARSSLEQQTLPAITVPRLNFKVQEFHLMESVLRPQGPLYRSVQSFHL